MLAAGLKRHDDLHAALRERFPEFANELDANAGLMTVQLELVTGIALEAWAKGDARPLERLAQAVCAVATSRKVLHPELESAIWTSFVMPVSEELMVIPDELQLVPEWVWELKLSEVDRVWNRAATRAGGTTPREGDRALADLLLAHGYVTNGGVLHAIWGLGRDELQRAKSAYEYFGLPEVSRLLARAEEQVGSLSEAALDQLEVDLNRSYGALVPDDEALTTRFEADFERHRDSYAPLSDE